MRRKQSRELTSCEQELRTQPAPLNSEIAAIGAVLFAGRLGALKLTNALLPWQNSIKFWLTK